MSAASNVAAGIAATLAQSPHFSTVYPLPSPQPESRSASVVPAGGQAETMAKSSLNFVVTVVATPSDYAAALAWLYEAPEVITALLLADPTCGGVCSGLRVMKWERVYLTSIMGGSDALALDVTLAPTYAKGI